MAAVPSVSVRERTRAAWESETRVWRAALAAGLLLWLVYAAIPHESAVRNAVIYPLTELAAVAAVVYGVRLYCPPAPAAWLLIAGGFGLYWIGDVIWGVYELQNRNPFPSPADYFYLAGYPLLAAGLAIAVWRRRQLVDHRATIDTALVVVSGTLLAWIYIIRPVLDDHGLSSWEKFVTISYPVGDLLLLAIAARFLVGVSWNVRSLRLLLLGLAATLLGDVLFNLDVVGTLHDNGLSDTCLVLGVVCIGLAGLHHTMTRLTDERGELRDLDDAVRYVGLLVICLIPPTLLAVQSIRGAPLYLPATIGSMVVVSILTVFRFRIVTKRALQAAEREKLLTVYAGELLRAEDQEKLYAVAERTAKKLIGDGAAAVFAPPGADTGAGHAFSAPVEVRGERVAALVADADPLTIRRAHDSLATVAAELALSLERERLLAVERETTSALVAQNERLLELDRMKDQFVSTVSHELRTPLTSMVGYLEILLGREAGDLNEEQQHFLEIVERNSSRLNALIEDILVTSRIDTGRLSLEPTAVDLGQLVAEQIESIRGAAEHKGVQLELVRAGHTPELWADPMRLGQVVDNLLSNAVKFTPAGGTVRSTLGVKGDTVRLEVSDTGVGIPPDEVDRLFDRFFRASTARTVPGTGLGLSIARGIAEAHGGAVTLWSELGVGTTFVVELPLRSSLGDPPHGATGGART
jgi:signal transduction histidine kinase